MAVGVGVGLKPPLKLPLKPPSPKAQQVVANLVSLDMTLDGFNSLDFAP